MRERQLASCKLDGYGIVGLRRVATDYGVLLALTMEGRRVAGKNALLFWGSLELNQRHITYH